MRTWTNPQGQDQRQPTWPAPSTNMAGCDRSMRRTVNRRPAQKSDARSCPRASLQEMRKKALKKL